MDKLKDKRKNEIRALRISAKIHNERWLDSQLLEIEKAPDNTKMFEAVKFLKPQKSNKIACEMEEVKSHFMKKFNSEGSAVLHKISTKNESFKKFIFSSEVAASIAKLKNGKCQDYDGNTVKILKYADKKMHEIIAEKFNRAIPKGEDIGLNTAILPPIQKPKKPQIPENLRPICIVPVMKKILSHIMLNRIREAAEKHIGHTQSAYRKGRSTADVIWTHRFNMVTSYTTKQEIHVTSLDMSSAFDTILRSQLINICETFLEQDDVTLIKYLLNNTKIIIKIDNRFNNCFSTSIGLPQGNSLSPILFSIYLREALKNLPSHLSGKKIIYSDDVDFVTEEEIDIKEICNTLKKYNLIVNKNKTGIITMKHNSLDNSKFKKLGSRLAMKEEIKNRKALSMAAMNKL